MRGRQTDAKALIVVAAEEDGAASGGFDAHPFRTPPGQLDGLRRRVDRTRQRGPYRRLAGIRAARRRRLSPRGELPGGATGARLGTAPPGALRGVVSEALDTGHASRSGQPRASRLLPRRIHLPLQPPQVRSRGKLFYRLVQQAVAVEPAPYKSLVGGTATRAQTDHNM